MSGSEAEIFDVLSKVLDSDEETTIVGEDERGPGKATADGQSLIWHFVADKVNDFAWATSADYIWKATRAVIPEKGPIPIFPSGTSAKRPVSITLYWLKLYRPSAISPLRISPGLLRSWSWAKRRLIILKSWFITEELKPTEK